MAIINHPHFGTLRVEASPTTFATTFGDRSIRVDINTDTAVDTATIMAVLDRVADLSHLDAAARSALRIDAEPGGSANLYVEHHLAEFSAEALVTLFGANNPAEVSAELFLSKMSLLRAGLYPGSSSAQIVLDYSVDPSRTQYLLAVTFDADGRVAGVAMES